MSNGTESRANQFSGPHTVPKRVLWCLCDLNYFCHKGMQTGTINGLLLQMSIQCTLEKDLRICPKHTGTLCSVLSIYSHSSLDG